MLTNTAQKAKLWRKFCTEFGLVRTGWWPQVASDWLAILKRFTQDTHRYIKQVLNTLFGGFLQEAMRSKVSGCREGSGSNGASTLSYSQARVGTVIGDLAMAASLVKTLGHCPWVPLLRKRFVS